MNSITKKCTVCRKEKPTESFSKWRSVCKTCYAKQAAEHRSKNPEAIKNYYLNNKEQIRKKTLEYYYERGGKEKKHEYSMAHKEEQKQRNIKYRETGKKHESNKKYTTKNKDKLQEYRNKTKENKKEYNRKYIQEHPEKISAKTQKRRAIEKNAEGSFTEKEWKGVCEKYNYTCLRCGKQGRMTPDHVIPLSKGGTSYISNIQPLCRECNSSKRDRIEDYR